MRHVVRFEKANVAAAVQQWYSESVTRFYSLLQCREKASRWMESLVLDVSPHETS